MWPWSTYPTTPLESAASPVSAPTEKDGQAAYDYIIVGGQYVIFVANGKKLKWV
jgi:hypothetical protein